MQRRCAGHQRRSAPRGDWLPVEARRAAARSAPQGLTAPEVRCAGKCHREHPAPGVLAYEGHAGPGAIIRSLQRAIHDRTHPHPPVAPWLPRHSRAPPRDPPCRRRGQATRGSAARILKPGAVARRCSPCPAWDAHKRRASRASADPPPQARPEARAPAHTAPDRAIDRARRRSFAREIAGRGAGPDRPDSW